MFSRDRAPSTQRQRTIRSLLMVAVVAAAAAGLVFLALGASDSGRREREALWAEQTSEPTPTLPPFVQPTPQPTFVPFPSEPPLESGDPEFSPDPAASQSGFPSDTPSLTSSPSPALSP